MIGCIGSSEAGVEYLYGLRMEILHTLSHVWLVATKIFRQRQMDIVAVQNPAVPAAAHLPETPSRNSPSNSYQWAVYQVSEHSHRAMDPNPVKVSFLVAALSAVALPSEGRHELSIPHECEMCTSKGTYECALDDIWCLQPRRRNVKSVHRIRWDRAEVHRRRFGFVRVRVIAEFHPTEIERLGS
jgi:hypothetical protein